MERVPPMILAAAGAAFLVATLDIVGTTLAMLSEAGTGRVFGTFLRDAVLIASGAFLLRRAGWAYWTLVLLFALSLLRVLSADQWHEYAGVALAAAGLALLLVPASRAWATRPAPAPSAA